MTDAQEEPAHEKQANSSPAGLLADVVSGFASLVRGELALARAEAKRSLADLTAALVKLVVAVIFGITGLNVLSGAAIAGLVGLGLTPLWASVAVGAGLLVLAFGLGQIAKTQLAPSNFAPKRIMATLRHDAETLRSMVVPDATSHP